MNRSSWDVVACAAANRGHDWTGNLTLDGVMPGTGGPRPLRAL
jgi:hypothetical protein